MQIRRDLPEALFLLNGINQYLLDAQQSGHAQAVFDRFYCSMRRNIKTLNVDDSYSTQVKHLPFCNGAAQYRLLFLQLTGTADIMLLLIDNYDSFTYNLYQYFCELGKRSKSYVMIR